MAMPSSRVLCLFIVLWISTFAGECHEMQQVQICKSTCTVSWNSHKVQRHTYRYSTTISSSMKGSSAGSGQLAFDCVVDIDTIPGCPDKVLRLRNPQIKQSSLKRDSSVLRLKTVREALEKKPLRFRLQGGKVTALCPQGGEQVWALNIKRAILSMLQTSHSGRAQETKKETDIHGTCLTSYEQKGPSLVKTRHLQHCHENRVNDFWWHSVPLKEDMTVNASLKCTQYRGAIMMDKVNCTETVVLMPLSGSLALAQTRTVSNLTHLRRLEGIQTDSVLQDDGYLTDLRFEIETVRPGQRGARSVQEVSSTTRRLCAHSADQQQQLELFLSLALQLRSLSFLQLREVWQEVSFKCHDDWQPLLDALPACGTEACIHFTTNLIHSNEIDQDQSVSFLSNIPFVSNPTPSMISHISSLLKFPLLYSKAMLAVSALVYRLCLKGNNQCSQVPEVQQLVRVLQENLGPNGCGGQDQLTITELLHVLKAVENTGLAEFIPHLNVCISNHSAPLEARLAALQAFRRIRCHLKRGILAWVYQQPQEDVEVRIAAYQQLMHCPDQEVYRIIRATLRNETSTQVGSFVWSHLFNIMKTDDPRKKDLMESLPHDIISKDFEAEPWKYSSHMDHTMKSGAAVTNVEGSLIFSPKSFLPRSGMLNVTVYILGRSINVLEASLRMENVEPFLWSLFEGHAPTNKRPAEQKQSTSQGTKRQNRSEERGSGQQSEDCGSSILNPIKAKFTGQKENNGEFRCWINVKMLGIDLSFVTCNELLGKVRELSLGVAGVTVKLLKGQEVKLSHKSIVLAEELVLPSLSGLPMKLGINMSSYYSLWLKGSPNFRNWSQFSFAGYLKPNAFVGISTRMGVDGAFGRVGLEWVTQVRTSTSLDGGVYVHNGQSLKMVLNAPEDIMDILSFSSRMYQVSGEIREELIPSRNLKEKTTCSPKTWSKLLGWQLCSDITYPLSLLGNSFPPPGPVIFMLRFQKLDRGLHKYLLEAAYALVPQRNSWMPLETNLLIFFGTPQSTIPRDISLDFSLSPKRLILKMVHPLKTILIQGQFGELNGLYSGRAEVLIDDSYHYYLKGLMENLSLHSEQRIHYQLEAKLAADGHPVILSANVTHGLSGKIGVAAKLSNVFIRDASFSVQLERRQDSAQWQYSVDAGLLLPNLLNTKILGLLESKGSEWNSGLRIRYGVQENSKIMQECHMTQKMKDELKLAEKFYSLTAEHELQCSHIPFINHKIQVKHERKPGHVHSSLDLSYGVHWTQGSNKQRILLSQSIRNQSGETLTSYAIELSLRIPDKGLNYRTQFLHSHLRRRKSEISTHLKVNYNDQIPLVAGLQWKDMSAQSSLWKYEGSLNMDTPWLYVYVAHRFVQLQHGTTQFTSEITTRKWVTIRNLMMEGLYRERTRDREGRLHIYTPTGTYLKVGGYSILGKRRVNASYSINTAWTPALEGEISLGNGKDLKTMGMTVRCGKQSLHILANLNTVDKKLKKRLLTMSLALSALNNPYLELDVGGRVEETRKDLNLYQKRWVLHFRQPFKFLPPSLHLQKTFTIDLRKGTYVLESKLLLHDNRKAIHVLTLGYRPHQLCSSLIHSLNLENVPQDLEICLSIHNNETTRVLQARMLTAKTEKVAFLGQVQLDRNSSSQQGMIIKAKLTHLLQINIPSSMSLDADLRRNHLTTKESEYTARGKVVIDDKDYDAFLSIERSAGNLSGSIYLGSNSKTSGLLDVSLGTALQWGGDSVNFNLSLQQTLFPELTSNGHLHLYGGSSTDRFFVLCALRKNDQVFRVKMYSALEQGPGLQLSLTGDLIHSLPWFSVLPCISSIAGLLNSSRGQTEGKLMLTVEQTTYGVELKHDHKDTRSPGELSEYECAWICFLALNQSFCINISGSLAQREQSGLQAQLTHSFPWLQSAAGLPFNSSASLYVNRTERVLLANVGLLAGSKELKVNLQRRASTGSTAQFLVNCTGAFDRYRLRSYCYTEAMRQSLSVEIWAKLSEFLHVAPENQGTLVLDIHHLPSSTSLTVDVRHNVSSLRLYIPFEFYTNLQLNRSLSSIETTADLLLDDRILRFEGQVSRTKFGFTQMLEFGHSLPQLMPVPSTLLVRTEYAGHEVSHILTHNTQWMDHSLSRMAGLQQKQSPTDELGFQLHGWRTEVRLENEIHSKRAVVLSDWALGGEQKQIKASGLWSSAVGQTEAVVTLEQPFTSTFSQLHLQARAQNPERGHGGSHQVHVSWDHGAPVNISVAVHDNSSRWQACILVSPGQIKSIVPVAESHGCVSVEQDETFSSQSAELKWGTKKITQNIRYQRADGGMHSVQMKATFHNISPGRCPSHTLEAQIHTNLRDSLEHHVLLGFCPPNPALSWAGSHRVNSGKDLLYSHTGLSVSGQNHPNTFVLALRNTSSSQRSHYSLLTQWNLGNWSVELGGRSQSSSRNSVLQVQAKLDGTEMAWLQASVGKRCVQAAAGYNGDSSDDLRATVCLDGQHWLTVEAQRRGSDIENETLAQVSMGTADTGLVFNARGCERCVSATEARLEQIGSRIQTKLLERVLKLRHLLLEFRRQAEGNPAVEELGDAALQFSRRAELLMLQTAPTFWDIWMSGSVRHTIKYGLPRMLLVLQHTTQLIQQELRKPLVTLAGAYHDVTGERPDIMWQQALETWRREMEQLLSTVLHNHHLRSPSVNILHMATTSLDLVMQHTVQWAESRLAMMLVRVRRQLAFMYKFSERNGEVRVRLPLPRNPWAKKTGMSTAEFMLAEFLMKPLLSLTSGSITAEFYRLKRRLMDSPFNHQAFLIADQYMVSFDGHVLQLPPYCSLALAADVTKRSFGIALKSDRSKNRRSLLVQLQDTTVTIRPHEQQVDVACHSVHLPFIHPDVTVTRELNLLTVSNKRGLLVTCDSSLSVCSVTLDFWLHGRASGLLGTNDNEAVNEYLLPSGLQAHSVDEFILGWKVDPKCVGEDFGSCQNQTSASLSCRHLFSSSSSSLSNCFRVVDPKQFLAMCERSRCEVKEVSRSSLCRLTLAYIQLCNRNYVPLELPTHCA